MEHLSLRRPFCAVLFFSLLVFSLTSFASEPSGDVLPVSCPRALLIELNHRYLAVHAPKENNFWGWRMALPGHSNESFQTAEQAYKDFISDPRFLPDLRRALAESSLTQEVRQGLEGWRNFFETNAIEDAEAKRELGQVLQLETEVQGRIYNRSWAYADPQTGNLVPATQNRLGLMVAGSPEESLRRSAYQALLEVEDVVLHSGLTDLIRARNRFARRLGFRNYFEYRLQKTERMSVEALFAVLDDLEQNTRDACRRSVDAVADQSGSEAKAAWNFDYFSSGDLKKRRDPYFPIEHSLGTAAATFARLGVDLRGARSKFDLLERAMKYPNGFMHGPTPSLFFEGVFEPAEINVSSNAVPGEIGAGESVLTTELHEMGHLAHFAGIKRPSLAESQEHPPFSMAFAEVQSMSMDALVSDPRWLVRYAKDTNGNSMPEDLILESALQSHRFGARHLRRMLVMPYFERTLYEMPDEQLTPETIRTLARRTESELLMTEGAPKPVTTFVHLLSGEAAGTYHGYVLARLGVHQTRRYFENRYGFIVDNPAVGRELAETYWAPGSSKSFTQLLQEMTGEPFSAQATIQRVNRTEAEVRDETLAAVAAAKAMEPHGEGPVRLNLHLTLVHGEEEIAVYQPGEDFLPVAQRFAEWLKHWKR